MSIWEEDIKEVEEAVRALRQIDYSEVASKYWIKVEEWASREDYEFIGVDGSFSIRPLSFSTLYLARAIAISPSIGNIKMSKCEILDTVNDDQARQHVKAMMSLLEVEVASKALVEAVKQGVNPIVLFDGSLSSIILNQSPRQPSIRGLTIKTLSSLVEEGDVIFIAKRSSNALYEKGMPDMMLFSFMPMGYSKPHVMKVSELYNIPEALLDHLGLTSKLKVITIFYVKLAHRSPLLKFEVPGVISESEAYEVISRIKEVSPAGYPVPLFAAHNSVKLSSMTLRRALSLMGIRILSGREVLREVSL